MRMTIGRKNKVEEAKQTWKEMMVGIILADILMLIIGIWFFPNKITYFTGIVLGAIIALALLRHMFICLDVALDLEPKVAEKYARSKSIIRLLMMGVAVSIAGVFPQYFNVVGACFGVLGLKFSAFLQPLVHKYIFKQ